MIANHAAGNFLGMVLIIELLMAALRSKLATIPPTFLPRSNLEGPKRSH